MGSNILITSAGRRVSLIKAFKKELKEVFPYSMVIAADSNTKLSAGACVANDYFNVPNIADPFYIKELLKLCKEQKIGLVIPTLDIELILYAEYRDLFNSNGIIMLISDFELVRTFNNKKLSNAFFNSIDVATPIIYSKNDFQIPLFIKPLNGSASKRNYVIRFKEELSKHHENDNELGFFEYIDPNDFNEYTCDLYYDKESYLKCVVPRLRMEVRSGESSKGITHRNILCGLIKDRMNHIPGMRGCITVQFFVNKKNNSIIKGIEINPRFGGGYPLSYLAGANYPKWIIDEYFLNKKIEVFDDWEENLLMLRYDDEILIHEFKG